MGHKFFGRLEPSHVRIVKIGRIDRELIMSTVTSCGIGFCDWNRNCLANLLNINRRSTDHVPSTI
jgi:hypothetical protein